MAGGAEHQQLIQRSLLRASIPATLGLLQLATTDGRSGVVLIALAVALFQVSVFHERIVDRWIDPVVRAATAAISVAASMLAFMFVLFGWLLHAVSRVDVLHRSRAAAAGWTRMPRPGRDDRSYLREEVSHRGRWRIRGLVLMVLVLVSYGIRWKIINDPSGRSIRYHQFAFPGEPWGRDAVNQSRTSHLERDGAVGWHLADHEDRYVNIEDSTRRSWAPPDPELTVWMFGGSAAFGIGQRDEHTIPSELARAAARDGIGIRVVNFGTPGYMVWQEASLLRIELSRRADPDLVVLYHGANDLLEVDRRAFEGAQPLDAPGSIFEDEDRRFRPAPKGPRVTDPAVIAAAEIRVLRTQTAAAQQTVDAAGVPLVTAWQPSLWSMPSTAWTPEMVDAAHTSIEHLKLMRDLEAVVVPALGPHLVDLRHSFHDAGRPTFFDVVHTNEAGARIVAEDLYAAVRSQLRELQRDD